jgi:hypothetical protein
MTEQEKKVKEYTDGRYNVHKTDSNGNVLVYDRIRDNITRTGKWIDKDGKEKPY